MSEIHEAAGSYALNALDAAELVDFEIHLATCETCSGEVAELCETAVELSLLSLATPPDTLRDNILEAIRNTPQLPAEDAAAPSAPPTAANGSRPAAESQRTVRATGPRRALPGTEVPDEPDEPVQAQSAPVDELALRRHRRRSRFLTGLVAAVLALAVGLGGVVYTLVQQRQAQVAQIGLEQQLYAAPDLETFPVELTGGGKATFVWSTQLNRALFIGSDLPDPGKDKRYQLWTMDGEEPKWKVATRVTRDTPIDDRDSAVRVFFDGDIAGSDWLCVSVEPKDNLTDTPTVPPSGAAKVRP